jgi:tryptophan-rich hypothetical protein
MPFKITNSLSPKKLLLSKWTAVHPTHQRKHFLVIKVIVPEAPNEMIQFVELEAVFDKRVEQIAWRELTKRELWQQGWL